MWIDDSIPHQHMMTNSKKSKFIHSKQTHDDQLRISIHLAPYCSIAKRVSKRRKTFQVELELRGLTARRRRRHLKVCRNVQRMKMVSAITRIKGGKLMIIVLIALVHGGKKVTQSAVFCGWSVGVYFQTHDDQLKIQIYSFQTNT